GQGCMTAAECCTNLCSNGVCGPPPCKPDGQSCMTAAECCTGLCSNGVCGKPPPCKPAGAMCSAAAEGCSGACNNSVCGPPSMCPSDGTACGDCVSQHCCNQLDNCLNTPMCLQNINCFFMCIQNGGGPIQCGFQCVNSPQAFQLLTCIGQQC